MSPCSPVNASIFMELPLRSKQHEQLHLHCSCCKGAHFMKRLPRLLLRLHSRCPSEIAGWTLTCRACLSRRSEYYHAMLHSPFQEGRAAGSSPVTTAQVIDVSPEVLEAALLWMYTDNIPAAVEEAGDLLLQVACHITSGL